VEEFLRQNPWSLVTHPPQQTKVKNSA
jgi:hypothetical protein